jgi:hypothetical protein
VVCMVQNHDCIALYRITSLTMQLNDKSMCKIYLIRANLDGAPKPREHVQRPTVDLVYLPHTLLLTAPVLKQST